MYLLVKTNHFLHVIFIFKGSKREDKRENEAASRTRPWMQQGESNFH